MAENLDKWPSKRGPICKIRPSDGCRGDAVPLAPERRYDFAEFGGYLGNVELVFFGEYISRYTTHRRGDGLSIWETSN